MSPLLFITEKSFFFISALLNLVFIKYTQENKILGIYSLLSSGSAKFSIVVIVRMLSLWLRNYVMKAYLGFVKFCQIKYIVHPSL